MIWVLGAVVPAYFCYLLWVARQDKRRGVPFDFGGLIELYFSSIGFVILGAYVVLVIINWVINGIRTTP